MRHRFLSCGNKSHCTLYMCARNKHIASFTREKIIVDRNDMLLKFIESFFLLETFYCILTVKYCIIESLNKLKMNRINRIIHNHQDVDIKKEYRLLSNNLLKEDV